MKVKFIVAITLVIMCLTYLCICVGAAVPGDINGDSVFSNDDLSVLVRYLSGSSESVKSANLDADNNGKINNRDAIIIAQALAGWNVKLHTAEDNSTIKYMIPNDGNALRIAFIGDSITEGIGSSDKTTDSYPAQLQTLLGDEYVVGNFGKSGAYVLDADSEYNVKTNKDLSYRNTQQYKDSLEFGADVVVVILGINDIRSMLCDAAAKELKDGLVSLVEEYKALDGVQKVYVGLSVRIANSNIIQSYCDGPLQQIQREAAEECGVDILDLYSLTRDYLNVNLHYTKDITHPNTLHYSEIARAMYSLLMGENFIPTVPRKSQTGVVYLKTGGLTTGNGATPDTAINSIAKAVGLLRDGGGTIVVCGAYSTTYETMLPTSTGTITITSEYGGVDYAKTNGARFGLANSVFFHGDFDIDNINIVAEASSQFLVFGYNDVHIGAGVECSLASTSIKTYPILVVGHSIELEDAPAYQFELRGECNVTVDGGTWAYIRGGNRRHTGYCAIASSDKDARLNITINGGTFNATSTNFCSATGMGGFAGECNFTVNGGIFKGTLYAVSRAGNNINSTAVMSGKINMYIRGGTFEGGISAVQDTKTVSVTGKCNLTITEALKNKASGFSSVSIDSTINHLKARDGEALRIAFIGDSITEGIGSTNKLTDSYPAQLQGLLGEKYVIGNFGKSGAYVLGADSEYNVKTNKDLSYRNTQQYKDSLGFGADVVVVILGINDIRSMSCDAAAKELKDGLISLVEEYKALDGVQKVYVGLSVCVSNCNIILSYCDGPLQAIQKEVAAECEVDVLDLYSLTRDYLNVNLHYTADITHPNSEHYTELARAMKSLLLGEEFTPTIPQKSKTGVVYLKSGGLTTGLGATPDTAIDSLAKAVGLLRDGGGTIVVCGEYTTTYETMLPTSTGTITITSIYEGVDYSSTNGAVLGISKHVYFHGDFVIDDIDILVKTSSRILAFGYNDVKIGDGVVCTLASGVTSYPVLLVGHSIELDDAPVYQFELEGECNVTVNGGTWGYIRGGNRRNSGYCAIASSTTDAKLNITINGGTFMNTATNLCSGTGMGGFAGECNFIINGGSFMGDVFAVSRAGNNLNGTAVMSGTVNMTVSGGTFAGGIIAVQDAKTVSVTGKCNLNIKESLKDKASGFTTTTVIQ